MSDRYFVEGSDVYIQKFVDEAQLFAQLHSEGDAHRVADTLNELDRRTQSSPAVSGGLAQAAAELAEDQRQQANADHSPEGQAAHTRAAELLEDLAAQLLQGTGKEETDYGRASEVVDSTDGSRVAVWEQLLIELVDRVGDVTVDTRATSPDALDAFLEVENRAFKFLHGRAATRATADSEANHDAGAKPNNQPSESVQPGPSGESDGLRLAALIVADGGLMDADEYQEIPDEVWQSLWAAKMLAQSRDQTGEYSAWVTEAGREEIARLLATTPTPTHPTKGPWKIGDCLTVDHAEFGPSEVTLDAQGAAIANAAARIEATHEATLEWPTEGKDGGPGRPSFVDGREVVNIARCPVHGLHGARTECFDCGGPVEQVPMVEVKPHELDTYNGGVCPRPISSPQPAQLGGSDQVREEKLIAAFEFASQVLKDGGLAVLMRGGYRNFIKWYERANGGMLGVDEPDLVASANPPAPTGGGECDSCGKRTTHLTSIAYGKQGNSVADGSFCDECRGVTPEGSAE